MDGPKIEVSDLKGLEGVELEVSERELGIAGKLLSVWAEDCNGFICPQVEGFHIGGYLLARVGIPVADRTAVAIGSRGNIFKIWADLSEEGGRDLNYFCPFNVPEGYDLTSAQWSCESDDYGPHVRILIPKKTNV